jgi:hypothetical protein
VIRVLTRERRGMVSEIGDWRLGERRERNGMRDGRFDETMISDDRNVTGDRRFSSKTDRNVTGN